MLQIVAIGLSAFLLFLVQPMISKIILPLFGGGSSIWLTAMIFFQIVLLAGYGASHLLVTRSSPKKQAALFGILLVLTLFVFLPLKLRLPAQDLHPAAGILLLLLFTVGLPYFLLAATSPLVQHWIAADPRQASRNPYIQYAVSNLGSMGGLLVYPFLVEPGLPNSSQVLYWSGGFVLYAALLFACMAVYLKGVGSSGSPARGEELRSAPLPMRRRARWVFLAMVPCAALMVFTHYITVDLANMPLLWVVPLCLYLLSFVLVFLFQGVSRPGPIRTLAVIVPVGLVTLIHQGHWQVSFIWKIVLACAALFAVCMLFHGDLEQDKPKKDRLTFFYLYLSLGGCLGGILAGIVAPLVLRSTVEFQVVVVLALYFAVRPHLAGSAFARNSVRVAVALFLVFVVITEEFAWRPPVVYRNRSFYGAYTIHGQPAIPGKRIAARLLTMGTTAHGGQARDAAGNLTPIAYYHRLSAAGQVLTQVPGIENIGVVGLGAGVLALYGRPGQTLDFFELDPLVVEIARERFDNIAEGRARPRFFTGDARIRIREIPPATYDVFVVDAFTSGAIPIHLLTLEALEEIARVVKPGGVILYHISNAYVDLYPVLACDAEKLGLAIAKHTAPENNALIQYAADWALLTRNQQTLRTLAAQNSGWEAPKAEPVCWTDDYSAIWSVISINR